MGGFSPAAAGSRLQTATENQPDYVLPDTAEDAFKEAAIGRHLLSEAREFSTELIEPERPTQQTERTTYAAGTIVHHPPTLNDGIPTPGDPWYISNVNPDEVTLFMNGIRTDQQTFADSVEHITNITGRTVSGLHGIHNNTRGALNDIYDAIRGFLSSRWGSEVEKDAMASMKAEILGNLRESPERTLRLVVHSQGAIITSGALFELRAELSPSEWHDLTDRISILALGAGSHCWPNDIPREKIRSFAHSGDIVPQLTLGMSHLQSLFFTEAQVVRPTIAPLAYPENNNDSHAIDSYSRSLPSFLIEAAGSDGPAVAQSLISSIRSGEFPDSVIEDAIQLMLASDESAAFAKTFLREYREGVGNFATWHLIDM